jgi:hypothetical protein
MAMSAKERKQKQIQRELEEFRILPDSSYPYLRKPFFKHAEQDPNWSSIDLAFEMIGLDPPVFEDDKGPAETARDDCFASDKDKADAFAGRTGSVGRAESMVGILLDAAQELAAIVRRYKTNELDLRLEEIRNMDLIDPEVRKKALEETVHIEKIKDSLHRNVRRTIPQWEVKGV